MYFTYTPFTLFTCIAGSRMLPIPGFSGLAAQVKGYQTSAGAAEEKASAACGRG